MKELLLKVLDENMQSPFREFKYEVDKWYHCKNFDENPAEDCSYGFYATGIEGLTYAYQKGRRVFEVEVDGKNVNIDTLKRRWEKMKIVRELTADEIKKLAKEYEPICGYKLCEALFPFNPLIDGNPRHRVTKKDIKNLNKWASVRDSVRDSAWDSDWASVRASVRVYTGSLFPNIKKGKYIEHKESEYPYQCLVDLWYRGFVPSNDGKTWRLHHGRDAKIVYEEEK